MELGLQGRVALVCAASRGLGRGIARQLALEGADLVICSRTAADVESAAWEIAAESGRRVVPVACDVSTAEGVQTVLQAAEREFGRVDILISNSGGPPAGRFVEMTDEQWQSAINLLLMSAVRLTRAVLPGMQERHWGRILYVTSGSVKAPIQNLVLSNSIRAAVTGMAKTISQEVGRDGITVNCLGPGTFDTDRVRYLDENTARRTGKSLEEVRRLRAAEIPAGRYGDPDEFGRVAAFLCSDAGQYISGVYLMVDGGATNVLL